MSYEIVPIRVDLDETKDVAVHTATTVEGASYFSVYFTNVAGEQDWVADLVSYDDAMLFINAKEH